MIVSVCHMGVYIYIFRFKIDISRLSRKTPKEKQNVGIIHGKICILFHSILSESKLFTHVIVSTYLEWSLGNTKTQLQYP